MKLKYVLISLLCAGTLFAQAPTPATSTVTVNNSTKKSQPPVGTFVLDGAANFFITRGNGTPESFITASVGSLYLDTTGKLWIKVSGTGATGWALVGIGAGASITLTGDVTGTGTDTIATTYNNPVPTTKAGLPTGGTSGQVLQKNSAANYDAVWGSVSTGVTSVFTRTGAVIAQTGDYTSAQVTNSVGNPSSSTDNAITRFDGTTGKLVQNSLATIDDAGNITATNLSGTNTGNQTITLTNDITGTGTGSFSTTYNNPVPTTKAGLPTGGTTGQVLSKNSATNFDTGWIAAGGTGTVTSITAASPIIVSPSPLTTTGVISIAGSSLTTTDDPNITLSLTGTSGTALLSPINLAVGWVSQLAVSRGGTGTATAPANTVFGNNTGSIAAPGFQTLTDSQVPDVLTISRLTNFTSDGFVKTGSGNGSLFIDLTTYLTSNQPITLTGNVTGTGTTAIATTIANDSVTYAKMQNVSASNRFIGRITSGSGDPEEITSTQATSMLDPFSSSLKGLAPASGGGTTNFLRADGTWAAPPGGGGGGTPGGSDTFVQFNDGGVFGGDANFAYTKSNDVLTLQQTPAVNTFANSLVLLDPTAATSGNQQYSPSLIFQGNGWKTNSVAGSQSTAWRVTNVPVQGAGQVNSALTFASSTAGSGFSDKIKFTIDNNNGNQIQVEGGNFTGPGYSFINFPLTGMYCNTSNQLDFGIGLSGPGAELTSTHWWTSPTAFELGSSSSSPTIRMAYNANSGGSGIAGFDFTISPNVLTSAWAVLRGGATDNPTNQVAKGLVLGHQTAGGAAAIGLGTSISLTAEDSTTNDVSMAEIQSLWTNVTHSSNVSDFVFLLDNASTTPAEKFRIKGAGTLVLKTQSTAPGSPVEGWLYGNSTDHNLYYYDGTSFVDLTAAAGGLPPQAGHATNFLTTDGTTASWAPVRVDGIVDSTDSTKLMFFDISAFAPSTTRIFRPAPSADSVSIVPATGTTGQFVTGVTTAGLLTFATPAGGGAGDVTGPSSSVDSEMALFSGTTGKVMKRATGTGLAKVTSGVFSTITDSSTNWDTAFTERRQWDGGSTNLTAATGRTSLGLVIGTNVEAWDADLDNLAAITGNSQFAFRNSSGVWQARGLGTGLTDDGTNINSSGGGGGLGYVMDGGTSAAYGPTDGSTTYVGWGEGISSGLHTTYALCSMVVPKAGTIKRITWKIFVQTSGSSESVQHYLRLNDTTDTTLSTTETWDPGANTSKAFTYTGLTISVAAGDTIALKVVAPTWATNPSVGTSHLLIYIE